MPRGKYCRHVSEEENADIRAAHGLQSAEEIAWEGQAMAQQRSAAENLESNQRQQCGLDHVVAIEIACGLHYRDMGRAAPEAKGMVDKVQQDEQQQDQDGGNAVASQIGRASCR